ncbi:hypothetical protein AFL01nite_09510 [Aeromicrobium flavum]|uniref:Uncharacterized protein n=1 Tax=Aeromicrobium flavum TaxID=416568 RepID=A0A512HT50_9ACTN|nr:hypothetical protein [Aeromicrobium flavum]GEO88624.1 hypothetical protein AFL01nite_09510 [Aeromicrobium flavum]
MPRFFPLGTSRLHETMEVHPDLMAFPHLGYFHSSSQMVDVVAFLQGERDLSPEQARYFFRKDQTPHNRFDPTLWSDEPQAAFDTARAAFGEADRVIIEICSPQSYRWGDLHVQGNPNHYRDAPYAEVWREGYYATYDPSAGVTVFDDTESVSANVRALASTLGRSGKELTVLGHLVDPGNPNATRVANNRAVEAAAADSADLGVRYFDASPFVAEHGFRVLDNGTVDIHHLPHAAYPSLFDALTGTSN